MTLFPGGCMQCKYAVYILSRALSFLPPPPPLVGPPVRGWECKTGVPFSEFSISGSLVNLRNVRCPCTEPKKHGSESQVQILDLKSVILS
jgi:hypothetical protein